MNARTPLIHLCLVSERPLANLMIRRKVVDLHFHRLLDIAGLCVGR